MGRARIVQADRLNGHAHFAIADLVDAVFLKRRHLLGHGFGVGLAATDDVQPIDRGRRNRRRPGEATTAASIGIDLAGGGCACIYIQIGLAGDVQASTAHIHIRPCDRDIRPANVHAWHMHTVLAARRAAWRVVPGCVTRRWRRRCTGVAAASTTGECSASKRNDRCQACSSRKNVPS